MIMYDKVMMLNNDIVDDDDNNNDYNDCVGDEAKYV